jgi:hypothetical protein
MMNFDANNTMNACYHRPVMVVLLRTALLLNLLLPSGR